MSDEQARVLARNGNLAVTHLDGRAFPGVHIQGDTFANWQHQLAEATRRLHNTTDDADATDDLTDVVEEMTEVLRFYEATLKTQGLRRPYFHQQID
ncbi:DUF6959 family protein [Actinoplanes palleronii]|uniref:Uncharacterized protein n=1 Tax=Actinoplanes palleronii TaxID=113570 RepID=A0ABQ4BA25_9ACTN|nr:hypothetical protein [Actinoplanes palleronii]GIE67440.1 hypothetical protein Apa02nite_035480 [Actinoplanes palleronii]